jgi:hypothetical protein
MAGITELFSGIGAAGSLGGAASLGSGIDGISGAATPGMSGTDSAGIGGLLDSDEFGEYLGKKMNARAGQPQQSTMQGQAQGYQDMSNGQQGLQGLLNLMQQARR